MRCNALDRTFLALDFFDASINRIAAWVVGMRNMQKALLYALLTPWADMSAMQDAGDFTSLMVRNEELKTMPFSAIWAEFCRRSNVEYTEAWFENIKRYETEVLSLRK